MCGNSAEFVQRNAQQNFCKIPVKGKLFVSIRSTNFDGYSFWSNVNFLFQFKKIRLKLKNFNYLNKICDIRKKCWDEELFPYMRSTNPQ